MLKSHVGVLTTTFVYVFCRTMHIIYTSGGPGWLNELGGWIT